MNLLLDTHFIVWAAIEQIRISSAERSLLDRNMTTICCSVVSLWELRLKWAARDAAGQRKGPADPIAMQDFIAAAGWKLLPLLPVHAVTQLDTPLNHTDPFDELLLVQAQVEGLRLLTRDAKLIPHPLAMG